MEISLAHGGFSLTLPTGRKLLIPNTKFAAEFIYKILWDASHMPAEAAPRGYIGSFPTQSVVDAWIASGKMRERAEAKAREESEERFAALGITPTDITFNL